MNDKLQLFRKKGKIICIKCGWIAVDIPTTWRVKSVEIRGTSTHYINNEPVSYYDIAINGLVLLHIYRANLGNKVGVKPYFYEYLPL